MLLSAIFTIKYLIPQHY